MNFASIFPISVPFKKNYSVLFSNVLWVNLIMIRQRKKIFSKCMSRSKTPDCTTVNVTYAFKMYC